MEYYICKNHGRLPIDNFYISDINCMRKRCKKCSKEEKRKHNLKFYRDKDQKLYSRATNIRRDLRKKGMKDALNNITQEKLYDILVLFDGKCPFTGSKRACTIARWKHSSWEKRNVVFVCKAYAEALEMAHELDHKTVCQKKCITQMTRKTLQKHIIENRCDVDTHLSPWILNSKQENDEVLDTINDVPSMMFTKDAVKKIDTLINDT